MTYSNGLIQFKNLTENMMHTHAGLYKGKNAHESKKKINFNLLENIHFYHCCKLITTEYAEYQKL